MLQEKIMSFSSGGEDCTGSLFLPENIQKPPVIVMGHGYAAERHFGNRSYIEAFVKLGVAVFTFDYICSGESAGTPRRLVDPVQQIEDWESAIEFLRSLFLVDASRMILWGSSLGGGHVLTVASKDQSLLGVIAQVPHCDSRSAFKRVAAGKAFAAMGHGFLDGFLSLFGGLHQVPVVGRPGEGFAVLDYPGWYESYTRMAGGSTSWHNQVPARSLLKVGSYNPIDTVGRITCPVQIVYASKDQGVPVEDIEKVAAKINNCELQQYEGDHFDLYDGESANAFSIEVQTAFVKKLVYSQKRA